MEFWLAWKLLCIENDLELPTSASYLQRLYTVQSSSGTKNKTQDFMIDKHSIN